MNEQPFFEARYSLPTFVFVFTKQGELRFEVTKSFDQYHIGKSSVFFPSKHFRFIWLQFLTGNHLIFFLRFAKFLFWHNLSRGARAGCTRYTFIVIKEKVPLTSDKHQTKIIENKVNFFLLRQQVSGSERSGIIVHK